MQTGGEHHQKYDTSKNPMFHWKDGEGGKGKSAASQGDWDEEKPNRVCTQCGARYLEKDNKDEVCQYHPGVSHTHLRVNKNNDQIKFECCNQIGVGLHDVPGCTKGKHVAGGKA